jgi:hypothetical protein
MAKRGINREKTELKYREASLLDFDKLKPLGKRVD